MSEALAIREKHDGALADRSSVRLWLRLLSCTMTIEKDVQRRFAARGATLARFDVLAALDRHRAGDDDGRALPRPARLQRQRHPARPEAGQRRAGADRRPRPADRRASIVRLTAKGRAEFAGLAAAHHDWIDALVAGMDAASRENLYHGAGRSEALDRERTGR